MMLILRVPWNIVLRICKCVLWLPRYGLHLNMTLVNWTPSKTKKGSKPVNVWWVPRLKLNLTLLYSYIREYLVPSSFITLSEYLSLESIAGPRLVSLLLAHSTSEVFAKTLSHNEKTSLWWISENSSPSPCVMVSMFSARNTSLG